MSIYSRPYMQADSGGAEPSGPSAVKRIIVTLAAVYVLQNVFRFWFGSRFLEEYFSLSLANVFSGLLHTPLSYGFLHAGLGGMPWHLLLNCLLLFFFGRVLEASLGNRKLTELFLFAVVTGGFVWLVIRFITSPQAYLIGASAGVYGVITVALFQVWRQRVQLWLLPFIVEGRHIFYFFFAISAFLFLFGELDGTTVAHSAHLGGMLAGWLYHRHLAHRPALSDFASWRKASAREPAWVRRGAAAKSRRAGRYSVNIKGPANLRAEVDRILDKINEKGFGALTDEEKKTLDRAKEELR